MLKEITLKQAIERHEMGDRDILVLVAPEGASAWEDYCPTMLSSVLDRMRFLVDEEPGTAASPDPEPPKEEKPHRMVPADLIIKALETEIEPHEKKVDTAPDPGPESVKAKYAPKNLDNGKIGALHKAGWSHEKIAEEMGTTGVTIGNRIKKMKERGEL